MFFPLFLSKKYKAPEKGVDGNGYLRVLFDDFPSLGHAFWPINIIKNKNGVVVDWWEEGFKICYGGFFGMVAIKKDQIPSLLGSGIEMLAEITC